MAAEVIGQLVMHGSTLTVEAKDADISGGIIAESIVVGKDTTLKATAGDAKISIGVQAIQGIYVDGGKVHAQAGNAEFSSYGVISYASINVISGSLYAVSGDSVDGVSTAFAISYGDLHLGELHGTRQKSIWDFWSQSDCSDSLFPSMFPPVPAWRL